ncbi:neurotrypsin-like [Acanthaster planci]|uniref:Neurotrypsin-like n=1 Tax=Acanthaster planci TaxID=133434 RepID=A0A8B7ZJX6_ACAPL|nr:neurotrypsin-like [Acanthaster planci]
MALVLPSAKRSDAYAFEYFDVRIVPTDPPPDNDRKRIGLVEVFYGGKWGTICAEGWGFNEVAVACRKALVDYSFVLHKGWEHDAGNVSATVWLQNVTCTGHERNLDECQSDNKWMPHSCPSGKAAGAACYEISTISGSQSLSPFMADSLGNRYTAFEGNAYLSVETGVQMYLALCSVRWTDEDAAVFCRQMSNRRRYRTYTKSFFGAHSSTIADVSVAPFPVDFVCDGTEAALLDCPAQASNKNGICYEGNDAGAACLFREEPANFTVRLVGGSDINAGRVEVEYQGTWGSVGSVSGGDRDLNYGDVVCRMLDMGYATDVSPHQDDFGQSDKPVVVTGVDCTGAEPSLAQCGEYLEFVNDKLSNMTRDDTVVYCSGQVDKSRY